MRKVEPIIIDGIKHKKCSVCGRVLTYDNFGPDKRHSDGLRAECFECRRNKDAKYRSENVEKERERHKNEKRRYYERNIQATGVKTGKKLCPKCKQEKDVALFSVNLHAPDGLFWCCKECWSKYYKAYKKDNKEKEQIRSRIYYQGDMAKVKARNRRAKYVRELGAAPVNRCVNGVCDYEQHHLQLRTKPNGEIDKDKTIFIPCDMHNEIRHIPEGVGYTYRRNMPEITAAAFRWLLSEEGLATLVLSGEEYRNLLELIEEGKKANIDHIPKEYLEEHFESIKKLEQIIKGAIKDGELNE